MAIVPRYLRRCAGALALALVALAAAGPVMAAGEKRTLGPMPPKGQGEKCVADTDFMRRSHMTVLNHQRDDTVHDGIRTRQFSLKGCIDCHQVKGGDGRAVTVDDPKHFCRTCHDYAAVTVDCFQCHASRPGEPEIKTGSADDVGSESEAAALAHYLSRSGSHGR